MNSPIIAKMSFRPHTEAVPTDDRPEITEWGMRGFGPGRLMCLAAELTLEHGF